MNNRKFHGLMPKAIKFYAHDMYLCGIHLSALINDIFDASCIEAGEVALIKKLPVYNNRVTAQSINGAGVPNIHQ
jgi:hypothetical protein